MTNSLNRSEQKEQLVKDLRAVVNDAQQLIESGVDSCNAQASEARQRLEAALDEVRHQLGQVQPVAKRTIERVQSASDHYVHEHPWKAMGVAVGLGMLFGLLVGRR
jgi:ElaB/YqjD/DUF883 family membrane-anchored ribosome-binding protein